MHQDRAVHDAQVDAIDLTLSSPEPELGPQHQTTRHLPQQQPPKTVKQEPGGSYKNMHNDDTQRQGSARSSNVLQQQPRRVNPQHVKQIIDTSSPRALRHIVLQLCKSSPALSGAIARGLAPHSAYAQQLIRGQQARSQAHTQHAIKADPRPAGQDAYDRVRRQPGTSSSTHSSTARPRIHQSPTLQKNQDELRLPSSQNAPRMKRNNRTSPTGSDDSNNIVDFSEIGYNAIKPEPHSRTPTDHTSRHPSIANIGADRLAVRQRPTQSGASDQKPKLCLQCGELFKEGEVDCYHHTGHEGPTRSGDIPQYTCCRKFVGEPGCTFGRHMSERAGTLTNSKRPSPSPYDSSPWLKKPRVL